MGNVPDATRAATYPAIRRYKYGFIWFRPEGLAYEYTLAALGERVAGGAVLGRVLFDSRLGRHTFASGSIGTHPVDGCSSIFCCS